MKKLLLLALSLGLANGVQALEVGTNLVEKSGLKLINFKMRNSSDRELYCRSVSIPEVNYLDDGLFVESLPSKAKNLVLAAKESSSRIQDVDDLLRELYIINDALVPSWDNGTVRTDCEVKKSRLNRIYVVDDRTSCGGGFKVSTYSTDFGKDLLVKKDIPLSIALGANTRIVKNAFSKDFLKIDGDKTYLMKLDEAGNESLKLMHSTSSDRYSRVVGAIWSDHRSFFLYVLHLNKLEILKYKLQDQGEYQLVGSKTAKTFDLNTAINGYEAVNKDQAILQLKRNFEKFAGAFSFYHVYLNNQGLLKIVFTFRKPTINTAYSKWDFSTNTWKDNTIQLGDFASSPIKVFRYLDIKTEDFIVQKDAHFSQREFINDLERLAMRPALPNQKWLAFKNLNVSVFENTLQYTFGTAVQSLDGFCNIKQIFSDRIMARPGRNLDELYMGQTLLTRLSRAQRPGDYEKAEKLLFDGAKVDKANIRGNTPLHLTMGKLDHRFVKLFLANGANANAVNKKGMTPLHRELLNRFGPQSGFPNFNEQDQNSIIKIALNNIDLLLRYGARQDIPNKQGETARAMAIRLETPKKVLQRLGISEEDSQ